MVMAPINEAIAIARRFIEVLSGRSLGCERDGDLRRGTPAPDGV